MKRTKLRLVVSAGITIFLVAAFAVLAQPPGAKVRLTRLNPAAPGRGGRCPPERLGSCGLLS